MKTATTLQWITTGRKILIPKDCAKRQNAIEFHYLPLNHVKSADRNCCRE